MGRVPPKRSYGSARGAAEKRARYLYVHLITSQVRWQTSALFRQLVNSSSLEQHRDVYTRLIREEADPDEDRLDDEAARPQWAS